MIIYISDRVIADATGSLLAEVHHLAFSEQTEHQCKLLTRQRSEKGQEALCTASGVCQGSEELGSPTSPSRTASCPARGMPWRGTGMRM